MSDADLADATMALTPGTQVHCGGLLIGRVIRPWFSDASTVTGTALLNGMFYRGQDGKLMVPVQLDGSRLWTWWGVNQCTPI